MRNIDQRVDPAFIPESSLSVGSQRVWRLKLANLVHKGAGRATV